MVCCLIARVSISTTSSRVTGRPSKSPISETSARSLGAAPVGQSLVAGQEGDRFDDAPACSAPRCPRPPVPAHPSPGRPAGDAPPLQAELLAHDLD